MIVDENLADHIDMNFGCPVPKVTRKGGGAALPYKRRAVRPRSSPRAVKATAGADVPVTVKFRIGIDDEHHTYLDAGRIAAGEGAAAVALHARTASQRYSGTGRLERDRPAQGARHRRARCSATATSSSAEDALAMMAQTGCDGVVVGRGCLGRPWLFARAERGASPASRSPRRRRSARWPRSCAGTPNCSPIIDGEDKGLRDLRKHMAWYFMGFPVGVASCAVAMALVSAP